MSYKFKVSTLTVVLAVLLGAFSHSCQEESNEEEASADLPYLSFSEDSGTSISNLSENDLNSLISGFQRIDLKMEGGLYCMETKSAAQINISEKLFSYFESMVEMNNRRIIEEGSDFSLAPRTRDGGESSGSSNDCVAQTIVNIAGKMNSSMDFSQVKRWIVDKYGTNGVPSSKMSEVINHYFIKESVTIRNGYAPSSGQQVFVVMRGDRNDGHAARYLSCTNGYVLCDDKSLCQLSQVTLAYLIKGVR